MSVLDIEPSSDTKPMTMRKPDELLLTWMPWRWTSMGKNGVASASLFCTCTCAMSGSTSGENVNVMPTPPDESLEELM